MDLASQPLLDSHIDIVKVTKHLWMFKEHLLKNSTVFVCLFFNESHNHHVVIEFRAEQEVKHAAFND